MVRMLYWWHKDFPHPFRAATKRRATNEEDGIIDLGSFLLGSCFTVNHKKNYFVVGQFEMVEGEVDYCLEVEEISKNAYELLGKINMVKDVVINKCFSVQFYECIGGESILVDLVNLKDEFPRAKAVPASYIDDNGVGVVPFMGGVESLDNILLRCIQTNVFIFYEKGVKRGFVFTGA